MIDARVATFRTNVQRASLVLSGQFVADRPRWTAERIEGRLREIERPSSHKPVWLASHTFDGDFDPEAFRFLSEQDRGELTRAVAGVRDAATGILEGARPHPDQLDRARPHFVQVVELMGYDRYDDDDAYILGKIIEGRLARHPPPRLDQLRFRTGYDSTGDPALWVWAFVKETGEHDEEAFFKGADEIDPPLKAAAEQVAPDRLTYISYRSTLDQLELEVAA